ncbi:ABC transporter permease [Pedococcus sp. 2YAF34]|uniref:ABC transporter permease n=1 Tax=Pedococcus sp. 2YAF34 TaxID=3233032 RepID=UPI003F9BC31B
MTTLTPPRAQSSVPERPDGGPSGSRFARWRASWRVALRMAWRDARRHRGRSILVFVMVALPTGLLVGIATFASSETVTGADRIPLSLGPARAAVTGPDNQSLQQGADPDQAMSFGEADRAAKAIPGFDRDVSSGAPSNVAAIQRLTGGEVVRVGTTSLRHRIGDRSVSADLMVLDTSKRWGDKAHLLSGRWATGAREVVVTPYGISRGMPTSGAVTLSSAGQEYPVTVVGTASAFNGWGGMPDVVTTEPIAQDTLYSWQWLVLRDTPVTYTEVKQLNTYGLRVFSADVVRHPPTDAELPPELRQLNGYQQDQLRVLVAVGAVMLFIVTTLLVAPAFAVSASRQRRTLALAASNGAETRQLRRKVLAQALVLGAGSAVVSAVLAVGALRLAQLWWVHHRPWTTHRYFDLPVAAVSFVVVCSVLSALVAAMIPAARLGRLDIVGVMRGQSVSPRLNTVAPVLGAVVAVAGGAGLLWAVRTEQREIPIVATGLALVLGALLLVPLLLVGAGRLASRLPVAPRLATRDAARHRTRSVPTVTAIVAGAIALTMFSIGLASDTEQRRREYQPRAAAGEGFFNYYPSDAAAESGNGQEVDSNAIADRAVQIVRRVTPHLVVSPLGVVQASGMGMTDTDPLPVINVVPPGCTPEQTINGGPAGMVDAGGALPGAPGARPDPSLVCNVVGSIGMRQVGVLSAADLASAPWLSAAQKSVVADGGILLDDPKLVRAGTAQVATGSYTTDPATGMQKPGPMRVASLPAAGGALPFDGQSLGALVSTDTARARGWSVSGQTVLLRDPDGAISRADQDALSEAVGDEGEAYVERGFQRDDRVVMLALFGGFALLLLIVTLISTALSLAEQRADLGTFAAVGATRGTRRRLAAAQASVVALIGAVLGIAVGLVPGIALTYPLTSQTWDPATGIEVHRAPIIEIPWLPLAAVVVGVPLVAALLSYAAIRKAPAMTRRAD